MNEESGVVEGDIRQESKPWGDVTDPNSHDPASYRYLVHAINPMASLTMPLADLYLRQDHPDAINKDDGDQTINLFSNPEKLDQRVSLSCSLIDQDHYGTWGSAGLIVESPEENVVITSSEDVGTINGSKKFLEKQALESPQLTAEELLQRTYSSSYNEVVALANHDGKRVSLAGFFYKTNEDGSPKDEALFRRMRMHSERLKLPLIPIVEPNPYKVNEITNNDTRLSVKFGGKFSNLRYEGVWSFTSYDQNGYSSFVSPEELEQIINYLQSNNISAEEVEQIRKEYLTADKERQLPKVTYDEQGNVKLVEKVRGYGDKSIRITIGSTGYARRVNVLEEAKRFSEMMADTSRYQTIEPYERDIASPYEAEQVVQELINNASEEDKQKIEDWWRKAKENVVRQWNYNQEKRRSYFGESDYISFYKK